MANSQSKKGRPDRLDIKRTGLSQVEIDRHVLEVDDIDIPRSSRRIGVALASRNPIEEMVAE